MSDGDAAESAAAGEADAVAEPEDSPVWAHSPGDRPGNDWTPEWLVDLRAADDQRHAALLAAALLGLGLAMVHWLGLFVAGALVGLVARTVPRALAAGLAVGVLVLVVHVGASPVMSAGEFLGLGAPAYLSLASALVAPLWGSLARAVL